MADQIVARFCSAGLIVPWVPIIRRDAKRVGVIKRLLTLQIKVGPPGNEFLKPYELFRHVIVKNVPYWVLPRAALTLLQTAPALVDQVLTESRRTQAPLSAPPSALPSAPPQYKLNANQEIAMAALVAAYGPINATADATPNAAVFLRLKPGFGKTVLALDLIRQFLPASTLYVVPRVELAKQVRDDAERFLPGLRVGIRGGGDADSFLPAGFAKTKKRTRYECHLLICVINSAVKLPAAEIRRAALVVLDECHEYCTPTFMGVFALHDGDYEIPPPALLAMSGTPMESKLSAMLPWFVAPLLDAHELPGFQTDLVAFTTSVQPIAYRGPPAYTETLRRAIQVGQTALEPMANDLMLKQILCDPWRLQLLVQKLDSLLAADHCVFIFADRREFLQNLLAYLRRRFKADTVECPEVEPVGTSNNNVGSSTGGSSSGSPIVNTKTNTNAKTNSNAKTNTNANSTSTKNVARSPQGSSPSRGPSRPAARSDRPDRHRHIGLLIGQERPENIAAAKKGAHVILCTYKYGSTGISLARMTAIILATPRKAKTDQTIARILRLDSDASIHRLVYDFVDEATPMRHQFSNRKDGRILTYQAEEMTILPAEEYSMRNLPTPTLEQLPDGPRFVVLAQGVVKPANTAEEKSAVDDMLIAFESNDQTVIMAGTPNALTRAAAARGWLIVEPAHHVAKTPDVLLYFGSKADQKKAEDAAARLQCRLQFEQS